MTWSKSIRMLLECIGGILDRKEECAMQCMKNLIQIVLMIDCGVEITFVSFEVASARLAYFHIQYTDMPILVGYYNNL